MAHVEEARGYYLERSLFTDLPYRVKCEVCAAVHVMEGAGTEERAGGMAWLWYGLHVHTARHERALAKGPADT